jgi:hypothetical protein
MNACGTEIAEETTKYTPHAALFFFHLKNEPMFLEQQERRMGMTWHIGIESTVVFSCARSVKIIDLLLLLFFSLLLLVDLLRYKPNVVVVGI